MRISILTLFPDMFVGPLDYSIVKRAKEKNLLTIHIVNIRAFSTDNYKTVDDHPYGGGVGMILRVDVLDRALTHTLTQSNIDRKLTRVILMDPKGTVFTQRLAQKTSRWKHVILICGHYEGVDERIRTLVDEEISIGDFITTGGELPAMILVDSIVRLLPGVLKQETATVEESFTKRVLEHPQYTRPPVYKGKKVPEVLLSGDHKKIETWKSNEAIKLTKNRRPDLLNAH